jgi:hypothetical protein
MIKLKDLRLYHNKFEPHTVTKWGVMRTVSKALDLDDL